MNGLSIFYIGCSFNTRTIEIRMKNIIYHAFYAVVRYQNTKNTFSKILYPKALYENDNNSKGHKFHLNYLLSI